MEQNNEFSPEEIAKVKDRLEKLMRMAADASSPNEAAIAAARVRKLKDKYDLHDFETRGEINESFGTARASRVYTAIPLWISCFATAVARYNDVQSIFQQDICTHRASAKAKRWERDGSAGKRWGYYVEFRGYETDVQVAVDMFKTLCDTIDRLGWEYQKSIGYTRYNVGVGNKFKTGASMIITDRLKAITTERDMIASNGTSLVVVKTKAVDDHFGELKYGKVNLFKGIANDDSARRAGERAGRTIEIVRSVES